MTKKMFLVALFSLFTPMIHGAHCTMVGSVMFPKTICRVPQLIGYYRGMKIDIVDGSYQVPIKQGNDGDLLVLITLGPFHPVALEDLNTISHFCLAQHAHYKCYRVRKNQNYLGWLPSYAQPRGKKVHTEQPWMIQEIRFAHHNRCIVPDSSFIILADPKVVESLENEPWQTQGNTCRMPRVVLKKMSAQALRRMADEALLASLDLDPFHRKPGTVKQASSIRPAFTDLVLVTEHHETHHFGH